MIGLWYWCTDQYIVQRALGAPDEQTARRGSIFAAFLKLFPVYLFIVPGLICSPWPRRGKVPELAVIAQSGEAVGRTRPSARLPADGQAPAAGGAARHRRRRPALRA